MLASFFVGLGLLVLLLLISIPIPFVFGGVVAYMSAATDTRIDRKAHV